MSEDQLRSFGMDDILTNMEVDEKPIITLPTNNI